MFVCEWTQEELASELGFDRSNISRIIRGKQNLPIERREKAEKLLRGAKSRKKED